MNKKLLLGTTNTSKVQLVQAAFRGLPIDLITPADLDLQLQVVEDGQTTLENAAIKAKTYSQATGLPSLGIDGGLWIEKLPAEKQPGTRVVRIQDSMQASFPEEILAYYNTFAN